MAEVLASRSDDRPSVLVPNGLCLLEVDEDAHEVGGMLDNSQVEDQNTVLCEDKVVVAGRLRDTLVRLERRVEVQSCSQFPGAVVMEVLHLLHTLAQGAYSTPSQVPLGVHHGIQLVQEIQLGRLEGAVEGGKHEDDYVVGGQLEVGFVNHSRYAQPDQLEASSLGVWYQDHHAGELCY